MNTCPTCNHANVPGTLFCEGCGSALRPEAQGRAYAVGSGSLASAPAPAARFSTGDMPRAAGSGDLSRPAGSGDLPRAIGGAEDRAHDAPGDVAVATADEARSFYSWEGAPDGPADDAPAPEAEEAQPDPVLEPQPVAAAPAPVAYLVSEAGRRVDVPGQDVAIVGREDARSGIRPDVDLTLDGASAAGVSRRHCRLLRQDDGWYVEDLMSTNYTVLNGQPLTPHTPNRVQHGDQLRLGKLRLTFHEN